MSRGTKDLAPALPRGWYAFDLPGYRDHTRFATYSLFDFEALPPIDDLLDDDFRRLAAEPPKGEDSLADFDRPRPLAEELADVTAGLDVALPAGFTRFMESGDLQRRVRSCTACFLMAPEFVVETTGPEPGHLVHFLSDQQWCAHWHLHVNRSGGSFVVASWRAYGIDRDDEGGGGEPGRPVDLESEEHVWLCARSFPEFMYRFFLENEIWFALRAEKRPLTPREQAYVDHYRKPGSAHGNS